MASNYALGVKYQETLDAEMELSYEIRRAKRVHGDTWLYGDDPHLGKVLEKYQVALRDFIAEGGGEEC